MTFYKKLWLLLILVSLLSSCGNINSTDDSYWRSDYDNNYYYSENRYCDLYNGALSGNAQDINWESCSSWNWMNNDLDFYFSSTEVDVYHYNGDYYNYHYVYSSYSFSDGWDDYVYYDIGYGRGFEFNQNSWNVSYYDGYGKMTEYR